MASGKELSSSAAVGRHQEIVRNLINSKAVDFQAIGKFVAEAGPQLAVADEPWENFCLTMRTFIRIYRPNGPSSPLENIGDLAGGAGPLKG